MKGALAVTLLGWGWMLMGLLCTVLLLWGAVWEPPPDRLIYAVVGMLVVGLDLAIIGTAWTIVAAVMRVDMVDASARLDERVDPKDKIGTEPQPGWVFWVDTAIVIGVILFLCALLYFISWVAFS